jgi:hypothetical protein
MKKLLILSLISLAFLSACKDTAAPTPSLNGFWKGKYSNVVKENPTITWALFFNTDGTMKAYDNADTTKASKALGKYTLTGNNLNIVYKYGNTANLYGNFIIDPKYTFIEGTWGSSATTTFPCYLNKQ